MFVFLFGPLIPLINTAPPIGRTSAIVQLTEEKWSQLEGYGMVSEMAMSGDSTKQIQYIAPQGQKLQLTIITTSDGVCTPNCINGGIRVDIHGRSQLICCGNENSQPVIISDGSTMTVSRETHLENFIGSWNLEYFVELKD
ncbi:unnamed protein product, partial [Mesorhabditis belari]|uniref:Uncharacterized protein n=1 Tax=Mesorhabditis belari TaxID=2138241 RepID=A0AAF3ET96_9BILA